LSLLLQVLAVILSAAKDPEGFDLPQHFGPFNQNLDPRRFLQPIQRKHTLAWKGTRLRVP
jgi:hypothetical protein